MVEILILGQHAKVLFTQDHDDLLQASTCVIELATITKRPDRIAICYYETPISNNPL